MRQITRRFLLGAGAALAAVPAHAATSARLVAGPWTSFGQAGDPDHGAWAAFLDSYLVPASDGGVARVAYARAARDGARLTDYLGAMQQVDPTRLTRPAAMSYWLNLYNALTVDLVVGAYPVDSIRDIGGGLFSPGPWREPLVTVAGRTLSLDDIEHGILRPVWRDPRVHYGVNCASIGCPDLAAAPFVSADLDTRLDTLARRYTRHPRGAADTPRGAVLSSIYDWFAEDFGGTDDAVLAHVNAYRDTPVAGPVADYRYDWSLNGWPDAGA